VRILWLSHLVPFPPHGGVLQRAYHLVHQTAKYHDVSLIAFIQKDLMAIHYSDISEGLAAARAGLQSCQSVAFADIPCEKWAYGKHVLAGISALTKAPYTVNWLRSREFGRQLDDSIGATNFDLVHFDTISLAPYRAALGREATTLDHHNVESHMMLRRSAKSSSRLARAYLGHEGRRLRDYEREVCPLFDSNIMCSSLDADRLQEFCRGVRTTVIPNGVDTNYFQIGDTEPSVDRLVFAGRLNSYPNREAVNFIAKEIWPRVKVEMPAVSMQVVGSNPPRDLVELASTDPNFVVTGYVDDVRPYVRGSGIYVCPIFDGGGTKLKILDAMAMGKAIVATRTACEGITVKDRESVIFAETADEFVRAISRLRNDADMIKSLGGQARLVAERMYSYDAIGKELSAHFEEVAESRRARPD